MEQKEKCLFGAKLLRKDGENKISLLKTILMQKCSGKSWPISFISFCFDSQQFVHVFGCDSHGLGLLCPLQISVLR